MRRSITAPVRLESENEIRGLAFANKWAMRSVEERQKADARSMLAHLPQPPELVETMAPGGVEAGGLVPNEYLVTLTRISPGYLDDDGLVGAFKMIRDEVARWCRIDDGHIRIRFRYTQEGCRAKQHAVRITVDDDAPGDPYIRELEGVPENIREGKQRGAVREKSRASLAPAQREIVFRPCFAVLPWEQDGDELVASELSMRGDDPPEHVAVRVPVSALASCGSVRYAPGQTIVLHRGIDHVDGQEVWLYAERRAGAGNAARR